MYKSSHDYYLRSLIVFEVFYKLQFPDLHVFLNVINP